MPSDLYEKYHGIGGYHRLTLDIEIASEVSRQIAAATSKGKSNNQSNIKGVIARRNQAREQAKKNAISDDEAINMIFGK